MNIRGNLRDIMAELTRQRESKIDVVLDGRTIALQPGGDDGLLLTARPDHPQAREFLGSGVEVNMDALQQLGSRLTPDVPGKFLKELAQKRAGLASHLLTGLLRAPKRHFVRMLDGRVRAFLSDRYRVVDHYDVAFAALDAVQQCGGEALEARLTDKKLAMTFTDRQRINRIREVVKTGGQGAERVGQFYRDAGGDGGELVAPYVTIGNSETGHGSYYVGGGLLRLGCVNGMVIETLHSQIHLGETLEVGRWSEETRSAEGRALILKCQDAVRAAFDPAMFDRMVAKANGAQQDRIAAPALAVDNLIAATELPVEARDAILQYFLGDYDPTRYGLAQAVSRYSQDLEDADEAGELESVAGKVLVGALCPAFSS